MYFPLLISNRSRFLTSIITFYNIFRNSGIASRSMRYHGQSSTFEEWYVRRRWYHHRCNRSSCPVGTRGGVIASWIHGARWKSDNSWYPLSHGHFCRSQEIGREKWKNASTCCWYHPATWCGRGFLDNWVIARVKNFLRGLSFCYSALFIWTLKVNKIYYYQSRVLF